MQKELDAISRVYDITVGKYDLTVQAGPSYSTQREELNTILIELIRALPQAAPVLMDLVVKTLDMPDADEVAERLQALMPPQAQGGPSPQMQQMQQQFQQAIDQAHQQLQQMGQKLQQAQQAAQEAQQDQQQKAQDLALRSRELDIKQFEAETARQEAATDAQRAAKEPIPLPSSPFGVAA
jgi:DNA repair exonuclease SbcCD ATPase subunit